MKEVQFNNISLDLDGQTLRDKVAIVKHVRVCISSVSLVFQGEEDGGDRERRWTLL